MRMKVVSKTRARLAYTQMIECFVRSESRIGWKFAWFRGVMRKHGGGKEPLPAKKEEENLRSATLFRYRDSPGEIQGEC